MTRVTTGFAPFLTTTLRATALGSTLLFGQAAQAADDTLTLSIRGLIDVHISCTVNGGSTENVAFGDDLLSNHIDGLRYVQDVPLAVACSAPVERLALWIEGDGAAFDPRVLKTSLDGLGIRFLKADDSQLDLGARIEFADPAAPPRLRAAPVKASDDVMPAGDFSATATLMVELI